jgi:hypothetical protein
MNISLDFAHPQQRGWLMKEKQAPTASLTTEAGM